MKQFRTILTCTAVLVGTFASAQQSSLSLITNKLEGYQREQLQEKVFVHTDQTSYLAGETVWFKIYVTDAYTHKSSAISKVAYVEIIDKDNRPALQCKIDIKNGMGNGGLFIPASINSGNYLFRCYTNWMKNSSEEFFFSQKITLINTFRKIQRDAASVETEYDIHFFPEGGHLVAGLKSRVAARVVNSNGKGAGFQAAILNSKSDTVASFRSARFGMGDFNFTPLEGEAYHTLVKPEGSKWISAPFPKPESQGVIFSLTDGDGSLKVSLQSTLSNAGSFFLLVHCRGQVRFSKSISVAAASEQLIPISSLGDGINAVTLFDTNLNPLCERLFFKFPGHTPDLNVNVTSKVAATRHKMSLEMALPGELANTETTNVSIAITRQDPLTVFAQPFIDQYLLFSSDLKGTIESPEYYFSDPSSTQHDLDLVLLCHGWSRFDWKDIFSGAPSEKEFIPEYRGPIITGQVLDNTGRPVPDILTYVASPGKNVDVYPSISNANGQVHFEMKSFFGSRKVILQTNFDRDSIYNFKVQNPYSEKYPRVTLPSLDISPAATQDLLRRSVGMQVSSIYWTPDSSKIKPSEGAAFYGKPDESYRLDDYTRFPVMEEVLREYVSGIWVYKEGNKFSFQVPDKINGKLISGKPLTLLDGVPVFSVDALMAMDPLKIKAIDIVGRKFYLNGVTFNGIASFRTYPGDLAGFNPHPKAFIFDYDGMQQKKEFYTPKYDLPEDSESRIPDRRNLLLWVPDFDVTQGAPAPIPFYTSDLKGKFRATIQGISQKGTPVAKVIEFSIE